ncbi:hypothetical protein HYT25_00695 [Candidatus Pacearchaeota archaeon]|nr:hypothetical protein [Candidatus Pacearchaeota archaeon]
MILHSKQELKEMREYVEELEDLKFDRNLSLSEILTLKFLQMGLGIRNVREIMGKYN